MIPESSFMVWISLRLLIFHLRSFSLLAFNELLGLGFILTSFIANWKALNVLTSLQKSYYFQLGIKDVGIWHCLVALPARVSWGLSLWALGYRIQITSLDQSPNRFFMNYWVLGKAVCHLQAQGTWNLRQNLTKGHEMTYKFCILNILISHFNSRQHSFGLLILFFSFLQFTY